MRFFTLVSFLFLNSLPVSAGSVEQGAVENYVEFLSRKDMTPKQNVFLAECMVDRLSAKGQKDLASANSEKGANLAMLADGQATFHGMCMVQAIRLAKDK
ncbi:MAG: hypothetical protein ACJAR5_000009 [Pseudophaeobacter arcticus]|jgi:hypothetical protein